MGRARLVRGLICLGQDPFSSWVLGKGFSEAAIGDFWGVLRGETRTFVGREPEGQFGFQKGFPSASGNRVGNLFLEHVVGSFVVVGEGFGGGGSFGERG